MLCLMKTIQIYARVTLLQISQLLGQSHLTFFVAMVMIPSQLRLDFYLMILTNCFALWNESALPLIRGVGGIFMLSLVVLHPMLQEVKINVACLIYRYYLGHLKLFACRQFHLNRC